MTQTLPIIQQTFRESKLTNEQKVALLTDYINGMKIKDIAAKYNVDQSLPAVMAKRLGIPRRSA